MSLVPEIEDFFAGRLPPFSEPFRNKLGTNPEKLGYCACEMCLQ